MNRDFRVGGPCRFGSVEEKLVQIVENAQSVDTEAAFMSSLAAGTQRTYRLGWRHWRYFCYGYKKQPRSTPGRFGWDGLLIKFIMRERKVLGLHPTSIRCKLEAIRFSFGGGGV